MYKEHGQIDEETEKALRKISEQVSKITKRMKRERRLHDEGRPHAYPLELSETLYRELDPKNFKKGRV